MPKKESKKKLKLDKDSLKAHQGGKLKKGIKKGRLSVDASPVLDDVTK